MRCGHCGEPMRRVVVDGKTLLVEARPVLRSGIVIDRTRESVLGVEGRREEVYVEHAHTRLEGA